MSDPRIRVCCAALAACVVIAALGCQRTPARVSPERFDAGTGATVSAASDPFVYARTEGRYSRAARDYIYLGPLETNRQGLREQFIWVGVATTLDRGFLAPEATLPDTLYLSVHGEPMEFSLQPLSQQIETSPGISTYDTAVDLTAELVARTTLDQLRLVAESPPDSISLRATGTDARTYIKWSNSRGWRDFRPLQTRPAAR